MRVLSVSLGVFGVLTPCIRTRLSGVPSVCDILSVMGILLCGSVQITGRLRDSLVRRVFSTWFVLV